MVKGTHLLFCIDLNVTNSGHHHFTYLVLKTTPGVSGHDLFVRSVGECFVGLVDMQHCIRLSMNKIFCDEIVIY